MEIKMLKVTSRPDSFRRAGREFTQVPTRIRMDSLTNLQYTQLKNSPELVVVEYEVDDGAEATATGTTLATTASADHESRLGAVENSNASAPAKKPKATKAAKAQDGAVATEKAVDPGQQPESTVAAPPDGAG